MRARALALACTCTRMRCASFSAPSMPSWSPSTLAFCFLSPSPPALSIFSCRTAALVRSPAADLLILASWASRDWTSFSSSFSRLDSPRASSAAALSPAMRPCRSSARAAAASASRRALGSAVSRSAAALSAALSAQDASAMAVRTALRSLSAFAMSASAALRSPAPSALPAPAAGAAPTHMRPLRGFPPPPDMVPLDSMSSPLTETTRRKRLSAPYAMREAWSRSLATTVLRRP
mmetsp:Transcript_8816/g.29173  ORF Transcript_8816/g.29173 Transcript_8816/m.29173 type:complete len:235 (+) Transcript_8816:577-1281(+)